MKDKIYSMTNSVFNFYPQIRSFFRGLVSIKGLDLSLTQLVCLHNIYNNSDITMGELADNLDMSNQQLTKLVDGLVALDMASRVADSNNRRQLLVNITSKGKRVIEMIMHEIYKKLAIFTSKMPTEEFDKLDESLHYVDKYVSTLHLILDSMKKDKEKEEKKGEE